jgi:hypothetical protein
MIDRLQVISIAGCVVFAALLLVELGTVEPTQPPVVSVPRQVEAHPVRRLQPPRTDEAASVVLGRPLFSETRRPAKLAKTDGPDASGLRNKRLTGIVINSNHRLAIFAVSGAKPLVRTEGEMVDEWRLDTIAPREVSLSGPDGTATLMPKSDPNRPVPARPQRPAANAPDSVPPVDATQQPAAPVAAPTQANPAVRVIAPPDPIKPPSQR